MKWDARFIFYVALCFGVVNECRTNTAPLNETKKLCDKFATDAKQHQTKKIGASTPETNGNAEMLRDENYQNDDYDYVVEDNKLIQNDQPSDVRFPYSYGSTRKQPQQQFENQKNAQHRDDPNIEYTKEVGIKQGRLKGLVRRMHVKSGLRNVDQYLGS